MKPGARTAGEMRTLAPGQKQAPDMVQAEDAEKEQTGNNRRGLPGGQDRNTVEPSSYQAEGQPVNNV